MKAGDPTGIGCLVVLGAVLLLAGPVPAEERVDLFDLGGHRSGYAIVDRQTGRIDFYDASSRRTGWGRVTPSGRIERFDPGGRRRQEQALPLDHRPERLP